MSAPETDQDAPPEEFDHADELLEKAEALIRRHQQIGPAEGGDDLPVLTDVVELDEAWDAGGAIDPARLAEHLIGVDARLGRALEDWVASELPQILSREFDLLAERLRAEVLAHLRATLLPKLSADISTLLERLPPGEE